ncbi:hypothetical protein PK98_09610 [Croceibacterium mercuriale]|uniref:Uncharacterized protein n=1 Tax=Croceibacterium mercuriale TaxID=1572751 RepID=A0A0B2C2X2_9SPHN|nr:hypothetical protein PK98_09610 [Croceibacterium mercuriale]
MLVKDSYALVNASIGIDQNERGNLRIALFEQCLRQAFRQRAGHLVRRYARRAAQTSTRNARRYAGIHVRLGF